MSMPSVSHMLSMTFTHNNSRFGNQASQFLGSLGFAKKLNRTLILPPWRTYKNVPFDEWFKVSPIEAYHRVITAEEFFLHLADVVWPDDKRFGFCWTHYKVDREENYCAMKDGNPFGPFWDGLEVNFVGYMMHTFSYHDVRHWKTEYPASLFPVIALKGPPASFPVEEEFVSLQRFLHWSADIERQASTYIADHILGETYVGIHLRNGPDWTNVCRLTPDVNQLMSSPQCYGYHSTSPIPFDICLPSHNSVIQLTKRIVEVAKATVVYVATDKDPLLGILQHALGSQVRLLHQDPWLPQLDLAILSKSDHFIGNCISSFSAFVARHRHVYNLPTSYWGRS